MERQTRWPPQIVTTLVVTRIPFELRRISSVHKFANVV